MSKRKSPPSDEQILLVMRAIKAYKADAEITSTILRNTFNLNKEGARTRIRRIMKGLAKAGKVRIIEKGGKGKRKQFNYELV